MKRTKKTKRQVVAYLRVSTVDQDTKKNENAVLKFANSKGFGKVSFVEEKVSGMKSWKKRKLKDVVDGFHAGDILIVPELSRLGRSLVEVLEIINVLTGKEVSVFSVKENFKMNGSDIQSKVMRTMLGLFAEIEHDLIVARTTEGIQAARAKGVQLGRPKGPGKSKLDVHKEEIEGLLKMGLSKTRIAGKYDTTPANLFNWMNKNKINVKPEEIKKGGSKS